MGFSSLNEPHSFPSTHGGSAIRQEKSITYGVQRVDVKNEPFCWLRTARLEKDGGNARKVNFCSVFCSEFTLRRKSEK